MKNWGIRTRVLLLALLPAFLIAAALAGYFTYRLAADIDRDQRHYGVGLSRQLAAVAEASAYAGDRDALRDIAVAALDEANVVAVDIYSRDGDPLASSGTMPARLSRLPPLLQPSVYEVDDERTVFIAPILLRRIKTSEPLTLGPPPSSRPEQPSVMGWVALDLSRQVAQARQREALGFTLAASLAVLLLSSGLAILLERQVTRPILKLEQAATLVRAGELETRIDTDSGGDLQRLEESFNAMAEALLENRSGLEARIRVATEELRRQKDDAERANLAKTRFLAAASHDLRQPLHALSLFAADLRHHAITPEQQQLAGKINTSIASISELLDALLDISRLDVAGVTPQLAAIPVQKLFDNLESTYARSAESRGIRFRAPPSGLWVHSDATLLLRLLNNLVSNAIRYTEHGSIMLAARRRGGKIRIEVRDSGSGIAAAHQQSIFDEFYQVGNAAREQGQGLGLGLAIVDRLARILQTKVELCSALGHGSVFAVTLETAASVAEAATAPAGAPAKAVQLWLVAREAEAALLREVEALATGWGFSCAWAASLAEASGQRAEEDGVSPAVAISLAGDTPATGPELPVVAHQALSLALLCERPTTLPPSAHELSLPLRPAKLRALLQQLLRL